MPKDRRNDPVEMTPELTTKVSELSIDDLLQKGLQEIRLVLLSINKETMSGVPSREAVMNLRDCMNMLQSLKAKEKEFIDSLSEEDLEKLQNK